MKDILMMYIILYKIRVSFVDLYSFNVYISPLESLNSTVDTNIYV